ncbi:hypothetical protein CN934_05270 [Ensifer sp. MMN_5]|nr:hypothetical protein CN934_05270 [Ensifer sp. MMN_5]
MSETQIIVFPLARRVGKIRTAAATLKAMRTEKMARAYRAQITAVLLNQLCKLGVDPVERPERVCEFWRAVHDEIAKGMEGAA